MSIAPVVHRRSKLPTTSASRSRFLISLGIFSFSLLAAFAFGQSPQNKAAEQPKVDADKPVETPVLTWEVEASHDRLAAGDSMFYARFRIQAAKVKTDRKPLNLALVFDRSGSMNQEEKIGYLRKAGHLVTDNLTKEDYLALVAYNHRVHTLVPLHPVVNREYLHHRIDELYAEGYTNLSAGLLEGCAQLQKRLDKQGLHHVILLTDGLANRGVTDPNDLVRLVRRCADRGITLTTVGVGAEYNETLLSRMAEAGGGRYVYVAKPEEIPTALKRELGTLLAVVAQNAKLRVTLPPGVEPLQVFGREEPLKPKVLEIPLGDLASGEQRVLLVKFRLTSNASANQPIELLARLIYDDVLEARRVNADKQLTIARADGAASLTTPVAAYAQLVESTDKIALAVKAMDRTLAAQVLKIRQREYPELKRIAWASRDQDFVNKAFMFEHYSRELQELIDSGALHEHSKERAKLQKELHYRRYLMQHHHHHH